MYCTNTLLPWSTCPTSRPMTELSRLLLLVTKGIFFSRSSCCALAGPCPGPGMTAAWTLFSCCAPGEVQRRLPAVWGHWTSTLSQYANYTVSIKTSRESNESRLAQLLVRWRSSRGCSCWSPRGSSSRGSLPRAGPCPGPGMTAASTLFSTEQKCCLEHGARLMVGLAWSAWCCVRSCCAHNATHPIPKTTQK